MKKLFACLLACLMLVSILPYSAAFAAEENTTVAGKSFTLNVKSNFFPDKSVTYQDLSKLEDANGDVFLTVEFKVFAAEKSLINLEMRPLIWDNSVLEFKEAYNQIGEGRNKHLNVFPFAGSGTVINTFRDDNGGRLVGNYSAVQNCPAAYGEDGAPVTVIRTVFKVLDKTASEATVDCTLITLSLCDETLDQPYAQYLPITGKEIVAEDYALGTYSTVFSPDPAAPAHLIGDVNLDGRIDITDATYIQMEVAKAITLTAEQRAVADTNADGKIDITDATYIQMYIAKKIDHLG